MNNEQIAHDLTLLYLSLYDSPQTKRQKEEGEFVGRYVNTKNRIISALPGEEDALSRALRSVNEDDLRRAAEADARAEKQARKG